MKKDLKARQNCRNGISRGRWESPLKHMERGRTSPTMPLAKKDVCVFLEYIQEKRIHPFWPTKQARSENQHYTEVSLCSTLKGRPHKV